MIKNYKNSKTKKVHETGSPRGFKGLDGEKAARRMDLLEAADSIRDIPPLASINLHKLSGDRKDQWAISVNDPWRICFTPEKDGFKDVEVTDYHSG